MKKFISFWQTDVVLFLITYYLFSVCNQSMCQDNIILEKQKITKFFQVFEKHV